MRRLLTIALAVAAFATVAVADHQSPEHGLAEAERFREYRVYHLGEAFREQPLTAVPRGRDAVKRRPTFSFIYGDCEPAPCAADYEIQNYAACSRNLAVYPRGSKPRPVPTIRGAAVYRVPDRGRFDSLEVYTGRTTLVVFAPSYRGARRAVKAVRSADGKVTVDDPIPPPARGSLRGRLRCPR
jgi:hypothetical protein